MIRDGGSVGACISCGSSDTVPLDFGPLRMRIADLAGEVDVAVDRLIEAGHDEAKLNIVVHDGQAFVLHVGANPVFEVSLNGGPRWLANLGDRHDRDLPPQQSVQRKEPFGGWPDRMTVTR